MGDNTASSALPLSAPLDLAAFRAILAAHGVRISTFRGRAGSANDARIAAAIAEAVHDAVVRATPERPQDA